MHPWVAVLQQQPEPDVFPHPELQVAEDEETFWELLSSVQVTPFVPPVPLVLQLPPLVPVDTLKLEPLSQFN